MLRMNLIIAAILLAACAASPPTSTDQTESTETDEPVTTVVTEIPSQELPPTFPPTEIPVSTNTLISGNLAALPNNSCLYADETYRVKAFQFQFAQYLPLDDNVRAVACYFTKADESPDPQWWVVTPPIGIYTQMSMTGVGLGVLDNPAVNIVCSTCSIYATYDDWDLLSAKIDDPVINYTGLKHAASVLESGTSSYDGSGDPFVIP